MVRTSFICDLKSELTSSTTLMTLFDASEIDILTKT